MNNGIALLRPNYRRLTEDQPYGTPHSCFQLSKTIAESGRYSYTDIFDEELNFASCDYPFNSAGQLRRVDEMSIYLDDYQCVYLSNDLMYYVSQNLRLDYQRVPMIAEIGTTHFDDQWKNIFIAAITGRIAEFDGFIFKSTRTQQLYQRTFEAWSQQFGIHIRPNGICIPNGIDAEENKRSETRRRECRDFLRYSDEDEVFLAFNRVAPTTKLDYESLILNWRHVVRQNKNAKLLIAGAKVSYPDYRNYPLFLRNLARQAGISQYVTILENPYEVFKNARNALMSAADVFIHTAKGIQETTSLTILEAMSHSLPVIVSDWAGGCDLVTPLKEGFLIKTIGSEAPLDIEANYFSRSSPFYNGALEESVVCDAGELIKAAVELSRSRELRQKMGAAARSAVEGNYTLSLATEKRIDFFEACSKQAAASTGKAPLGGKEIIAPNAIIDNMSAVKLSPNSIVSLGQLDTEWPNYERWAEHADLSLKIIEALSANKELSAGEIFFHLFAKNWSAVPGEWPVFSGILIKMAAIDLIKLY